MSILRISAVKSYSDERNIEIDLTKKINLVYGQNGSGKSTISGYFYKSGDEAYGNCSFSDADKYKYIVYNSQFVEDSFYNKSEQPGIFTLSQENKDVMEAIAVNDKKLSKLKKEIIRIDGDLEKKDKMIQKVVGSYQTRVWDKTAHIRKKDGGLGDLMVGYLQKSSLFQRLSQQVEMEEIDTADIISDYIKLKENKNTAYQLLIIPVVPDFSEDQVNMLSTSLIPSGDSYLTILIDRLGNSDWIRAGLSYIGEEQCPFCQKNTIDHQFREEVKKIFDDAYDKMILRLKELQSSYKKMVDEFISGIQLTVTSSSYITDKNVFSELLEQANLLFQANLRFIQDKIDKPSMNVEIITENPSADILLEKMKQYNDQIVLINTKVENYDNSIDELKSNVWKSLRYMCNDLIDAQYKQLKELNLERGDVVLSKDKYQSEIELLNISSIELKKQTSNIEETVEKINNTLSSLGISHFKIKKNVDTNFFQICRDNGAVSNIYKTLSEGEKTLITFLYFLELCDGRLDNDNESNKEKLIVIDDPISSLSHDYIYEISSLIHHRIIRKIEDNKLVILTHNLFFFQELIKVAPSKKDSFEKKYQLYRVIKDQYSDVLTIGRDDIKNEYEALWMILKDVKQGKISSVVLPNIMRNILEYYFSFSCKMEKLSEELDKLVNSEKDINYKTFYRYINRGSHSDSINISYLGQISANKYLEMFEGIFKKTKDEQHFNKMLGVEIEEVA
ncbi:AAA family ATPase [Kluyvera intermedia]|uniref:AAA family ATPase n=1 Tax=Kluyvera intermedia TaxID=61648 RepID=UPI003523EC00